MLGFNPLASAPLSDDGGIAFEDGPRITESGDRRITESGDRRVTENFSAETHQVSASLGALGSSVYASEIAFRGASELRSSSSIAANGLRITQAASALSSSSGANIIGLRTCNAGSSLVAQSSMDAIFEADENRSASLSASSSIVSVCSVVKPASMSVQASSGIGTSVIIKTSKALISSSAFSSECVVLRPANANLASSSVASASGNIYKFVTKSMTASSSFLSQPSLLISFRAANLSSSATLTETVSLIPFSSLVYFKADGAWSSMTPYVNDNGTWKEIDKIYRKQSSVWTRIA